MLVNEANFKEIRSHLDAKEVKLIAVSKTKPVDAIRELYDMGQRDFGENYVQELTDKEKDLPKDVNWHFIGHLQSNKVKYIAPFVYLIHGVDSFKLLREINKQGIKAERVLNVLLQVHIAREETKFGFDEQELEQLFTTQADELRSLRNIQICGLMGMASFTEDREAVRQEFRFLKSLFDRYRENDLDNVAMNHLSMGMSSDYQIAMEEGSTMVRIGSLLFGPRNYNQ